MKNITLSAEEHLIESARARARSEHTTLNEQFRRWLQEYSRQQEKLRLFDETMAGLRGKITAGGRKFTREELNER